MEGQGEEGVIEGETERLMGVFFGRVFLLSGAHARTHARTQVGRSLSALHGAGRTERGRGEM